MSLKLPDDTDDGPREIRIEIDNVTRQYMEIIRTIHGFARLKVELVLSGTPDIVEAQWPEFLLTNVNYDASTISIQLNMETLEREPFPAMNMDPMRTPGLFDTRK